MDQSGLITEVQEELKGLAAKFGSADFDNAVDDALADTGWSFPLGDDDRFKIRWMKKRVKRHLFEMMSSENADKFKVEQINLHQKFDHYERIITRLDKEFEAAKESYPEEFATLFYPAGADIRAVAGGEKIDAGFAYESQTGKDKTYESDQKVSKTPE